MQPGLGVSWSHVPRTRILLERAEAAATAAGRSSLRSATLIKSSRQVRPNPVTCVVGAWPHAAVSWRHGGQDRS